MRSARVISKLIENKRNLHMKYKKEFDSISWLRLISENKESISNYWLNTIILKNNEDCFQKRLIEICQKKNIFETFMETFTFITDVSILP